MKDQETIEEKIWGGSARLKSNAKIQEPRGGGVNV